MTEIQREALEQIADFLNDIKESEDFDEYFIDSEIERLLDNNTIDIGISFLLTDLIYAIKTLV